MTPDVSIVIPTIGRDERLRRTLDSIKALTGPSFEVVVVDQSGGENVKHLMTDYEATRFRHVPQTGRGRARAIVYGASRARGRYLAITDDDVVVEPDWLSVALDSFERHEPCDAVVGRISPYGASPGPDYMAPQEAEWSEEQALSATGLWKGFGANQIFCRQSWDAVGGMDPRLGTGAECSSSDDWDVLYRMLVSKMSVWYSPAVRIWHDGWETAADRFRKSEAYDRGRMAAHIKCWVEVGGPALRDMSALTLRLFVEGLNHLAHRRRGTAWSCFRKFGNYVSGIPLGVKLACQRRQV